MEAGAASREDNPSASTNDGKVLLQATKSDLVGIKVDTTTHGVHDGLGLLVNFLLHEVGKFALHDFGKLNFQCLDRTNGRLALVPTETMDVEL